jgi:Ca2+-binding EF-hand superfamily protein
MKTTPVSILFITLLLSPSSPAETPSRIPRPTGDAPGQHFRDAWNKADLNGDNSLSFAEFSTLPRLQAIPEEKRAKLFQRLDKNSDNLITFEEMRAMRAHKPDGQNRHKRLWQLDSDKSGTITWQEFTAGEMFQKLPPDKQRQLFDRLDTNTDGVICPKDRPRRPAADQGENRPRWKRPPSGSPDNRPMLFQKLDANRDGFLDFNEFSQAPAISRLGEDDQENAFNKLDSNKDLKITPEELSAIRPMEQRRAK